MRAAENDEDDALLGGNVVSDEERFKDCQRLTFACVACQREVVLDAPFVGSVSHARHLVPPCVVCGSYTCTSKSCTSSCTCLLVILQCPSKNVRILPFWL